MAQIFIEIIIIDFLIVFLQGGRGAFVVLHQIYQLGGKINAHAKIREMLAEDSLEAVLAQRDLLLAYL